MPNRSRGRVVQGFPIQQAKVQRPPLRAATLHRPRLVQWLDDHINRRLIFVTAEAGYGKTTLLADWARRTRVRVLWYRLDEDDANWVSFVHYLVAAGREVDPGFAPTTSVLLDELAAGASNRAIVRTTLLGEVSQLSLAGPTTLVIEDFHHVDRVPEIRELMNDLLGQSAHGLTYLVSSRRKPEIPVSRLRAMGEVAELRRSDLRFRPNETDELFRARFDRVLEPDLLEDVVKRTEGWAASLQLVEAAIRGRSSADARSFVRGMTGAHGDLYDYLAEEVVGELDLTSQSFLMRTSVLRSITPANIRIVTGLDADSAARMVQEVQRLGFLDSPTVGEPGGRYHPLVREFLEARLTQDKGRDHVAQLHRRLAASSEGQDWRTAAFHYEQIGAEDDLQRVLLDSAAEIMARGEFDIAKSYVDRLGPAVADPAMNLFISRIELDQGRPQASIDRAQAAYEALRDAGSSLGYLALANYASINMATGRLAVADQLCALLLSLESPPRLRDIAKAMKLALGAASSGRVDAYQMHLAEMEETQRIANNSHYLGVTLLNSGIVAHIRGQAQIAIAKSSEAIGLLGTGPRRSELMAARMNHAWALAHLGKWEIASAEFQDALAEAEGLVRNEALIETADAWTWYGDAEGAAHFVLQAESDAHPSQLALSHLPLTQVELFTRAGRLSEAHRVADTLSERVMSVELAYEARRRYVLARLAVRSCDEQARAVVDSAHSFAVRQRAEFYVGCLEVLQASLAGQGEFQDAVAGVISRDSIYLTILAEHVVDRLDELSPDTFESVREECLRNAGRWRDPLRGVLRPPAPPNWRAAALLEAIGTREDVQLLRRVARTARGRSGISRLGQELARRLAPRVFVEDQGRVRIRLDATELPDLDARRKVLEVICFLITRPALAATRDEVLDAVWPDADPGSALNSLNQTLYFLRRVLEPGYVEDLSANYVHHDSDIVWLDSDLVTSRSIRCRAIIHRLAATSLESDVSLLASEYRAKFALDFSYEEWATAYRDTLHAAYLEAMEAAIEGSLARGRTSEAIALARTALEADATAEQIERSLLRGYYLAGAHAALREQYAHYAAQIRAEMGSEPPSLPELIAQGFQAMIDT